MRTALTIAGSDSGGGAGIQADLKSFASIGVHGTSVITCVTAQNTRSVDSIFPIPVGEIRKQLRAVLGDFDVRAAKTGFISKAGYCLATLLRLPQNGQQVAVVVLGARSNAGRFMETQNLFTWLSTKAATLFAPKPQIQ